ncbi:MAG: phosphoribosylglycinamide formyltransferase [Anaerolineae bacterium]|nr:MAG: phosphoribosylglycinamide formyltransferase [Anaerolineae bacterium]
MKRLCILISGSGSNLQALIDAIHAGDIAAEIVLVVSNRQTAYGLERARQAGIPTFYAPFKKNQDRQRYDADLVGQIKDYQVDLIVLAGWMHILSSAFLEAFPQRVINLHPALPGMFSGTHAIERAYQAYQDGAITESGCMVHYAIPEVDMGDVIQQAVVPILPSDTLADFETRMHQTEHQILVAVVKQLVETSQP